MDLYKKEIRLLSTDVDVYRRLRLSALFTRMQEAAIEHTTALGAGREKTLDKGFLWIVTQQQVQIRRIPEYDERLTHLDWPGKTMHLYFPRYFRLVDAKGSVLFEAVSYWVLIDEKTRALVFPESHDIYIKEIVTGNELAMPGRLRRQEAESSCSFKVPYSYIDLNGHMNNARYYDLAMDLMPEALRRRSPCELTSEHIGEARLGDTLSVACAASDDSFYICGEKDKPVFRMKLRFEQ